MNKSHKAVFGESELADLGNDAQKVPAYFWQKFLLETAKSKLVPWKRRTLSNLWASAPICGRQELYWDHFGSFYIVSRNKVVFGEGISTSLPACKYLKFISFV